MDTVELGRTLRALRRRADLSQRELAQRSGVPQATLARIESGRARDPRFRRVPTTSYRARPPRPVRGSRDVLVARAPCS
ncbi:helix-turn-helix domain-containing protein, partial [Micromonospora azadirachtae]